MQTTTHSAKLIHHALTLLFGAALAAGIWLVGYAELSWLGFVWAATSVAALKGGCSRSRVSGASRS